MCLPHPLVLNLCANAGLGCPADQENPVIAGENYHLPLVSGCLLYHCIELRIEGQSDKPCTASPPSSMAHYCSGSYSLVFSFWNDYEDWCLGPKMFLSLAWLVVNPLMPFEDGFWVWHVFKKIFRWLCITTALFLTWLMWRSASSWLGYLYYLEHSHEHSITLLHIAAKL